MSCFLNHVYTRLLHALFQCKFIHVLIGSVIDTWRKLSSAVVPLKMSSIFSLKTSTPVKPVLFRLDLENVLTISPWTKIIKHNTVLRGHHAYRCPCDDFNLQIVSDVIIYHVHHNIDADLAIDIERWNESVIVRSPNVVVKQLPLSTPLQRGPALSLPDVILNYWERVA